MTVARLHPTETSSETWEAETHGAPPLKVENWRLREHIRTKVRGIKPDSKLLLYTLEEHRNQETGKCCPGMATLRDETGLPARNITRAFAELISKGIIERVEGTGTISTMRTSRYIFAFDKPAVLALFDGDEDEMVDFWMGR